MKKYIQIKESILADINSGQLKVGDQLPVREELIKEYQVSRATLNKALSELIETGRLTAYRNRGTFVTEKTKKLKTALVANFHLDEMTLKDQLFFNREEEIRHIIISAARGKLDFLHFEKVENNLDTLSEYDSVIWIMPRDKMLKKLSRLKHKVIVVNRYSEDLSFVSTHHRKALYDMTDHFIKMSDKDRPLIYLDVESNDFICAERREGFLEACEKHQKFYRFVRMGKVFEENVECLMNLNLQPDKKSVLISPSQTTTGSVFRMAYLRNLKIEKDFLYSDFDNANSLVNTGIEIPSILQDYKRMGEEVIQAAADIANGPVQRFIPHHLVNL